MFYFTRNPSIAIGGGFVEAIIHPDIPDRERSSGIMGLAFCGPLIRASSIVIPQDVTDVDDVEKLIIQVINRTCSILRIFRLIKKLFLFAD